MTDVSSHERARLPPHIPLVTAAADQGYTSSQRVQALRHSQVQVLKDGALPGNLSMTTPRELGQEKEILQSLWADGLESQDQLLNSSRDVRPKNDYVGDDGLSLATKLPQLHSRPKGQNYRKPLDSHKNNKGPPQEDVQGKPYCLVPSKSAPLSSQDGVFGFFPWLGDHPEDVLNESTVKSGYYDKSDQRQVQNSVPSKSTFKPPPRVTLTDAKRETWLKDLADSDIPLRRLSRTIPHGIRGKVLLDHCLAKNIPTWRAVWLAKCVGANEIRAFRRKGASNAFSSGGEAKWIREWTNNVQQFMDSLIATCAVEGWRDRMTYGFQLVAHIYSDQLLDRDLFIEWMMDAFRTAGDDDVPVWLLLIRIFWNEIALYRHRGRALVAGLIDQLSKLSSNSPVNSLSKHSIWLDLSSLLRSIVVSNPSCLVVPTQWPRYQAVITPDVISQGRHAAATFRTISRRNECMLRGDRPNFMSNAQPCQRVSSLLDAATSSSNACVLADGCYRLEVDHKTLVTLVLHWSVAKFRYKVWRVFIAARILRRWAHAGLDLNSHIIHVLGDTSLLSRLDARKVYCLIAELIRVQAFSVGKYLQWLLAKGITSSCSEGLYNLKLDLLDNIPLTFLSDGVLNLRRLVLMKLSRHSKVEEELPIAKDVVCIQLPHLSKDDPVSSSSTLHIEAMSYSARTEIAVWIKKRLSKLAISGPMDAATKGHTSLQSAMSVDAFRTTLCILGKLEDVPVLSDVLSLYLEHGSLAVLVAVVEYVNRHFDMLQAIGTVEQLFKKAVIRLADVQQRTPAEKPLFLSISSLAARLPRCMRTASRLRQELTACETQSNTVAYSPVSEQMTEVLHNTEMTFAEETELLLQSGTSMDISLVSRIFADITSKIRILTTEVDGSIAALVDLLIYLRHFQPEHFDKLMAEWIGVILHDPSVSSVRTSLLPLVSSRFISTRDIILKLSSSQFQAGITKTNLIIDLFVLVFEESLAHRPPTLSYGISTTDLETCKETHRATLSLMESVIQACNKDHPAYQQARKVVENRAFPEFLQNILMDSCDDHEVFESIVSAIAASEDVSCALDDALGLLPQHTGLVARLIDILDATTDFNICLCQLRLALDAKLFRSNTTADLVANILEAAKRSKYLSPDVWYRLLVVLDQDVAIQMHTVSLQHMSSMIAAPYDDSDHGAQEQRVDNMEIFLVILGATKRLLTPHHLVAYLNPITLGITEFRNKGLSLTDNNSHKLAPTRITPPVYNRHACIYLQNALRLVWIHQAAFEESNCSQEILCRMTVLLCLLLMHDDSGIPQALACSLFDTICIVSDRLNVDSRAFCAQILREHHSVDDSRLDFVLGSLPPGGSDFLMILVPKQTTDPSIKHTARESSSSVQLFPMMLKTWEMVQDATPLVGDNDTSLSLSLFGAKRIV